MDGSGGTLTRLIVLVGAVGLGADTWMALTLRHINRGVASLELLQRQVAELRGVAGGP
jgi:hypothetical protein